MPTFNFTLSNQMVEKLQALTTKYNENTGSSLTVKEWVFLHLKEIAIETEMRPKLDSLREEMEQQANANFELVLKAEKQRLLDAL